MFTALKHSNHNSVFRKCDPLLLFDCIRGKTRKERMRHPGEFVMDNQTLQIGIPTESFPSLAESCVVNKTMPMLKNVRLSEDQNFQIRWLEATTKKDSTTHEINFQQTMEEC